MDTTTYLNAFRLCAIEIDIAQKRLPDSYLHEGADLRNFLKRRYRQRSALQVRLHKVMPDTNASKRRLPNIRKRDIDFISAAFRND